MLIGMMLGYSMLRALQVRLSLGGSNLQQQET
jgi:hypothetical protein